MSTFEELIEKLTQEGASPFAKQDAISRLGELGDERAVRPLIAALQDEDPYVRRAVARALGASGSSTTVEPLMEALVDANEYVRRAAARALGALGSSTAVEPLMEALKDADEYVRRNAITALGALGDARAIEPLKAALAAQSFLTQSLAKESLEKIEDAIKQSSNQAIKQSELDEQDQNIFQEPKVKKTEPEISPSLTTPEAVEIPPEVEAESAHAEIPEEISRTEAKRGSEEKKPLKDLTEAKQEEAISSETELLAKTPFHRRPEEEQGDPKELREDGLPAAQELTEAREKRPISQFSFLTGGIQMAKPVLLIGLGGTGRDTLRILKGQFLENFGAKPDHIEFLVMDTEPGPVGVTTDVANVMFSPSEFLYLGNFDANRIVQVLDREDYRHYKAWFPREVRPGFVERGAAQTRPIGRMALFWHFSAVNGTIVRKIRELLEVGRSTDEMSQGLDVIIVTSICGGTGAGIFLDIAYLVGNQFIAQATGMQSMIKGILVLPGAFPAEESLGRQIQANAYSSLKELDYFMSTADFTCEYQALTPSAPISLRRKPFDRCYLIDTTNESGKKLGSGRDAFQLIARALFAQLTAPTVEQEKLARQDNIKYIIDQKISGKIRSYGSFGVASYVYPWQKIAKSCAYRLAGELVADHGILKPVENDVQVDNLVTTFIRDNKLDEDPGDEVINALLSGIHISMDHEPLDTGHDVVLQEAEEYIGSFRRGEMANYRQQLTQREREMETAVSEALTGQVQAILDMQDGGVRPAQSFLARLDMQLLHYINLLEEEHEKNEELLQMAESDLNGLKETLQVATMANIFVRGKRIRSALAQYIRQVEETNRLILKGLRKQLAIQLFKFIITQIQWHHRKIDSLTAKLRDLQIRYGAEEKNAASTKALEEMFVLEEPLVTPTDIDDFYKEIVTNVALEQEKLLDEHGPLSSWLDLGLEQLDERTLQYCNDEFAKLQGQSLDGPESLIAREEKQGGQPRLEALVSNLSQRAIPFWNYDEVELGAARYDVEQAEVCVVGIENRQKSLLITAIERVFPPNTTAIAETRQRHQVIAMREKHGLPLFALTNINMYQSRYEQVRSGAGKPVHNFPNAAEFPEPMRENE